MPYLKNLCLLSCLRRQVNVKITKDSVNCFLHADDATASFQSGICNFVQIGEGLQRNLQ